MPKAQPVCHTKISQSLSILIHQAHHSLEKLLKGKNS